MLPILLTLFVALDPLPVLKRKLVTTYGQQMKAGLVAAPHGVFGKLSKQVAQV